MAKVTLPLLSGDARGTLGRGVIYRRGGVVTRYFRPGNPNSAAQQVQRDLFREQWVGAFVNHGNQKNLLADDHPQYLTRERADEFYLSLAVMSILNAQELVSGEETALHTHAQRGAAFARVLQDDLTIAETECLVIVGYLDLNGHDLTIVGDGVLCIL
jgi:hypothetical protein